MCHSSEIIHYCPKLTANYEIISRLLDCVLNSKISFYHFDNACTLKLKWKNSLFTKRNDRNSNAFTCFFVCAKRMCEYSKLRLMHVGRTK